MTGNDVMGTGSHVPEPEVTGNSVTGTRNDVMGTESLVFWDGKPLISRRKGWRAQGNLKSRDLGWETADQ